MTDFTQDFIMRLKHWKEYDNDLYEAAVNFMSEECSCDKQIYTVNMMYTIIKEKFTDFMSTSNRTSLFSLFYDFELSLNGFFNNMYTKDTYTKLDLCKAMLYALQNVQVREKGADGNYNYINGFIDLEENYE